MNEYRTYYENSLLFEEYPLHTNDSEAVTLCVNNACSKLPCTPPVSCHPTFQLAGRGEETHYFG